MQVNGPGGDLQADPAAVCKILWAYATLDTAPKKLMAALAQEVSRHIEDYSLEVCPLTHPRAQNTKGRTERREGGRRGEREGGEREGGEGCVRDGETGGGCGETQPRRS